MNPNSDRLSPLPPIPIPPHKRWREFRVEIMPLVVLGLSVLGVVYIWRQNIAAPSLQGEAEPLHAKVTSPRAGILSQLNVARFQKVSQGDPVALITPADPRVTLALIQTEMDLLRARLEPRLSEQRNATDYERLRLEWLLQKVNVATARVDLLRAESEYKRSAELLKSKLISDQTHETALRNRDELRVEVEEKTKLIVELDQGLQRLAALSNAQTASSAIEAVLAALEIEEAKIKQVQTSIGSITLLAPADGMVSIVYRHPGENVVDGEPILVISALRSERIVGYLRQPFPVEPEVGATVEVRTRGGKSEARLARVLQVGSQLEPITNSLAMIRPGNAVDMGLPIAVSMPPDLAIRPGELVDLILRPTK